MFTVRFPTGVSIDYNRAALLYSKPNGSLQLYTKAEEKGGQWIATIQAGAGAIVEASPACKVENPTTKGTLEECAVRLAGELRLLSQRPECIAALRDLKQELRGFNITTGEWKEE